MVKDNGLSINKEKVKEELVVGTQHLLNDRYILVQKGKKNFFIVRVV
jgi:tyrosyl-tRNA synthetase